ncbi:hypothetical protein FSW04_19705 [Baekduia soli]|uniref:DUF2029 domain-containing protein n=1 Tax=Baekduia soli TaxID=496014 RepID=A0A5B8U8X2_9ACTN|nr:hypothetical protein [Baekduia soli]QEC49576.1 hypothetical protein FSW04_19705 [Baekduia soli]
MSTVGGRRHRRGHEPSLGFFRHTVEVSVWRLLILGLLAAALAALDMRAGLGPHDEGLMLQWGHRIAGGQWPYRDFWCNYLPGQPLVQALIGNTLWGWRVLRVFTGAAAAVLAYLLVRRETVNDRWALASWAAVAAAMAWPLTPGPNASATTLALGALLVARRRGSLAGALAGLAFLFRPEIGVAAAIGAAVLHGRSRVSLTPLAVAAAVGLAGLLPFLVVAPGDLLSQTFGFVGKQGLQRLPFPLAPHTTDPNKVLERTFPAILVVAVILWAASALPRRRGGALAALMVAGLGYLLARTDEFHLVPLSAVLGVGLAAAAAREPRRWLQVALAVALALIVVHGLDRQLGKVRDASEMVAVELPDGVEIRSTPEDAKALQALAIAVDERSRPGMPVLSAPPRYDHVRVGDTLLYTLLDRTNPTRYDVVQPGVVTTAEVQREMIRDLVRSDTRLIVRWESPLALALEDNGSSKSSGVHLLDDWIEAHFRQIGQYGDYVLLGRRQA